MEFPFSLYALMELGEMPDEPLYILFQGTIRRIIKIPERRDDVYIRVDWRSLDGRHWDYGLWNHGLALNPLILIRLK